MLNRKQAPNIELAKTIAIPRANQHILRNGTQLLVVDDGDVDVSQIDLIFDAGSRYQSTNLQARAALLMITEGTEKLSSQQISETLDYLGSFVKVSVDKDFAKVTAYSLNRNLPQTLDLLEQLIKQPSYSQTELDIWKSREKQSLIVEMNKVSALAHKEFFKNMFGDSHPYGDFALPYHYDSLKSDLLKDFHSARLGSAGANIMITGKDSSKHISLVEKHFGDDTWGVHNNLEPTDIEESYGMPGRYSVTKPDAIQSAIRVGRKLFKRTHPDYTDMVVVNTLFGGFFGSRLMKNIREEKGFTYGIYSNIAPFRDSGFFVIATEVGAQFTQPTLEEIWKEIDRLKNQPVKNNELSLVRSYLMGEVLRNFNGPFATASNIVGLLIYNQLDYSFYDRLISSINTITPQRIMELANKWLENDKMVECVAGAKSEI